LKNTSEHPQPTRYCGYFFDENYFKKILSIFTNFLKKVLAICIMLCYYIKARVKGIGILCPDEHGVEAEGGSPLRLGISAEYVRLKNRANGSRVF
jgi:hypothetical protein